MTNEEDKEPDARHEEKKSEIPKNPDQKVPTLEDGDRSGRTDYGGMPDRDLKKNLGGCG